ncbi:hypothetical protein IE81DRAFT_2360 [Ceraceosorus guamensis]|uniref:GTP-binding protein n=1 Tax=Ceraceosorus guamensis TaxID=1522189 RepID=A0A316W8R4_9BASI|nr:hypothetical protein IE81DRAFT_2360 [Ceraceosorus guamensis]PWN46269.1 hypothetical protein IE81DRAFT_2360 [Ceraceosorus guamensis]
MKKKILLMGRSGSGKTSMRSLVFSSYRPSDTRRLGSTLDVEHSHVRFLGNLSLNLWDCGGQQAYMDSYLESQRHQVFSSVGVLIYVFDLVGGDDPDGSEEWDKDVRYYKDCLAALKVHSPTAKVFCLLHKMDLVDATRRKSVYAARVNELRRKSEDIAISPFATSIWDETLYRAWSRIIHTLIPQVGVLEHHLAHFADVNSAAEVVVFERSTFLVISRTSRIGDASGQSERTTSNLPASPNLDLEGFPEDHNAGGKDTRRLNPERFEKISELVKSLKASCSKLQAGFQALEVQTENFSAIFDVLTPNTYIMVVVSDPRVELAAVRLNILQAKDHFEKLPALNIGR